MSLMDESLQLICILNVVRGIQNDSVQSFNDGRVFAPRSESVFSIPGELRAIRKLPFNR